MGKILALTLAVIIVVALAVIAIMAVYNYTHKSIQERRLNKVNELLDELEGK